MSPVSLDPNRRVITITVQCGAAALSHCGAAVLCSTSRERVMWKSTVFADCVFCVSGKFELSMSELTSFVMNYGGRIISTVSGSCTHLISDGAVTIKKQAAINKGVPIVSAEALILAASKGTPFGKSKTNTATTKRSNKRRRDDEKEEDEEDETDCGSGGSEMFSGFVFCVGGRLSRQQREIKSLITRHGGRVVGAFSRTVTHVIAEDINNDKAQGAIRAQKPVMSEAWIDACIKERGVVEDANRYTFNPDDDGFGIVDDNDDSKGAVFGVRSDPINVFFVALNDRHITARQNFSCCQRCGVGEIGEEQVDDDIGYCFYHMQDTESAAVSGKLMLAWHAYDDNSDDAVSSIIVAEAARCGLEVEWDGSAETRIALVHLNKQHFAAIVQADEARNREDDDENNDGEHGHE